jgi:hypothetical protein
VIHVKLTSVRRPIGSWPSDSISEICSLQSRDLNTFHTFYLIDLNAWTSNGQCNRGPYTLWVNFFFFFVWVIFFFFFFLRGCPGQLARTTTNPTAHWTPCKPNGHVRHRGSDRRAHENSNPGAAGGDKPLLPPGQDPQCVWVIFLISCVIAMAHSHENLHPLLEACNRRHWFLNSLHGTC